MIILSHFYRFNLIVIYYKLLIWYQALWFRRREPESKALKNNPNDMQLHILLCKRRFKILRLLKLSNYTCRLQHIFECWDNRTFSHKYSKIRIRIYTDIYVTPSMLRQNLSIITWPFTLPYFRIKSWKSLKVSNRRLLSKLLSVSSEKFIATLKQKESSCIKHIYYETLVNTFRII